MIEMYGILFTMLFNIAPLFQMVSIIRNGNSNNNSYGLWICGILGQICVLCYCRDYNVSGVFNYINSVLGILLNGVMIVLIYVYRAKK